MVDNLSSARPSGRARIETFNMMERPCRALRSARPSGRARIETWSRAPTHAAPWCSARPSGRARIETEAIGLWNDLVWVAPVLRGGRGLKQIVMVDHGLVLLGSARPSGRARIETCTARV